MRVVVGAEEDLTATASLVVAAALDRRAHPVLGVATGSSPLPLYRELARTGGVPADTTVFALDEYIGLRAADPRSYAASVAAAVTGPLGLDPARVHVPPGDSPDPAAACVAYERAIRAAGGVDVQIAGIGGNGHLAFNEPGAPFDSRTRVVALTAATRAANARFFDEAERVPTHAVTQGVGTVLEARCILVIARGAEKAAAVQAAIEGEISTTCPASALQLHADVLWLLDPAAAASLSVDRLVAN